MTQPPRKRRGPVGPPPEEAAEPSAAELFDEETRTAKRLADLAGGGGEMLEGESVSLDAIEDEEVTVLAFRVMPSKFNEGANYVCFQAQTEEGKLIVVNTSTMLPVRKFEAISADDLPAGVTFFKQAPRGGGKPYWNMK